MHDPLGTDGRALYSRYLVEELIKMLAGDPLPRDAQRLLDQAVYDRVKHSRAPVDLEIRDALRRELGP